MNAQYRAVLLRASLSNRINRRKRRGEEENKIRFERERKRERAGWKNSVEHEKRESKSHRKITLLFLFFSAFFIPTRFDARWTLVPGRVITHRWTSLHNDLFPFKARVDEAPHNKLG